MREDESNWFAKWEDELPSPDELTPLSQTLITPDLALAFDIPNPQSQNLPPAALTPLMADSSAEFDSADLGGGGGGSGGGASGSGGGGDEPARTLKRPRLVWTPQLHKRFVDAVAHLGIKNAVPKTIMQLMSVDGLTRENVASHLQKYRLYLKRMQGLSNGGGGGNSASGGVDPATDHLFASSPVPPHFLHPVRSNSDHFLPFVPVTTATGMQHPGHQMAAAAVVGHHPQFQPPYRHFGSPPNGHFDHSSFLSRHSQSPMHRMGGGGGAPPYVDDVESATSANRRKVLTLFPTGGD
ncbi:unnamed protein product [Cuscuta campestris]|uniref:HTH myb-type domain-containing protein n=1 Tax=Cuscuta campestris TaxID=132261 RepID=A0A484KSN5_9ASTE|nr:unnamed protein product [Cuscuta campestris]